jgi:carbamoyl-phosphate synthase small subunit
MIPSKLILETGEVFDGISPSWVKGQNFGEVVFNTGMVGYTEVLTDPSYKGQIIAFTYPMIGNYGVEPPEKWESNSIHAAGVIVSELAPYYSRSTSDKSLEEWCKEHNTPIISQIDTRALTKVLRKHGVVSGVIVCDGCIPKSYPNVAEQDFVSKVSIDEPYEKGAGSKLLIAVDCGMKANIWRQLNTYDIRIKRVPYNYDYTSEKYDGVFLSNGPGNPEACSETIEILKKSMDINPDKPIFGICLGSQIMGLAIGASTYKMKFGHRAQNHPCSLIGTDRSYLTSQNHGYAIDEESLPDNWVVSFRNLNDSTVQGIKHEDKPYSSVQFHPEACPGPVDTAWLFDDFISLL